MCCVIDRQFSPVHGDVWDFVTTTSRLPSSDKFTLRNRALQIDLGTAVKVHNPCQRLYIAVVVVINSTTGGEIRTWVLAHCSRMR